MNSTYIKHSRNTMTAFLESDSELVDIQRATQGTANDVGESALTWANVETDVVCGIDPIDWEVVGVMVQASQGTVSVKSYNCIFLVGTDVKVRDRIIRSDNNTLVIDTVQDYGTHIECVARIAEEV